MHRISSFDHETPDNNFMCMRKETFRFLSVQCSTLHIKSLAACVSARTHTQVLEAEHLEKVRAKDSVQVEQE